jgi:hypothetical protein
MRGNRQSLGATFTHGKRSLAAYNGRLVAVADLAGHAGRRNQSVAMAFRQTAPWWWARCTTMQRGIRVSPFAGRGMAACKTSAHYPDTTTAGLWVFQQTAESW